MLKRFLGVITTITVIVIVVFTVVNRSSYKSLLFPDVKIESIFKGRQVTLPQPTLAANPRVDTTTTIKIDSTITTTK